MTMNPTVLRSRLIRENRVIDHVVFEDPIARRKGVNYQRQFSKIAQQCVYTDVDDIITKPATIGPSTGNQSTVAERILNSTLQNIIAEDTQAGELMCRVIPLSGS